MHPANITNTVQDCEVIADKDSVPTSTMTELKKLGVTKVYLVSGTEVISAKVVSDLSAVGIQAVRIGGYDRYETAVNIAKEIQKIKPFNEIVVTNGYANVDAISIAPIAAAKGIPVLLVDKDSVPTVVSDFIKSLGISKTYVIGGTAVVSDSVKDALPNAIRLGGYDRFDTNIEVLKKFDNLIIGGTMFFANGSESSLIDSLTGAPMAAKLGGAIVLSNKEAVPDSTKGFIQTNIALKNPGILGGTAVMSDSAIQSLGYIQPGQSDILDGAVQLSTPNEIFKDKTVNGNILVTANGVTLQNVVVKGTLFLDPGKDGSATLDGVQASRIVVLSGADRSIYLKETKADSLMVSSSSDVHVVAETGTIVGSTLVQSNATVESKRGANIGPLVVQPQREVPINVQLQGTFSNDVSLSGSVKLTAADGAVVPTVTVTEATTRDSIQLAGQFSNVTINDNSDETTGTYLVALNGGVTLIEGEVLSITALVPGKTLSNATPVTVAAALIQTTQPTVMGTVGAGETMIMGTAEAGAAVSIKRSDIELGTSTADETTGTYMVEFDGEVTLTETDILSITATAPGKSESNVTNVPVVAALVQTMSPEVTEIVRAGDTMISGTTDAGAKVCVLRDGAIIGTATADVDTGLFSVELNEGVTLVNGELLSIVAKASDKAMSVAVPITVEAAL